jgi:hypothetical protein
VQQLEGRFLERCDENGDFWFPVSLEIARRKVSHALRDKFPLEALDKSFCSLKAKIKLCSVKCNMEEDCLYDAINLRVLQACIPSMEHASDTYVKTLLTIEVDKCICSLQKRYNESTLESTFQKLSNESTLEATFQKRSNEPTLEATFQKLSNKSTSVAEQVRAQCKLPSFDHLQSSACENGTFLNLSCQFYHDITDIDWKARNPLCENLGFNTSAISSSSLDLWPFTFSHTIAFDRDVFHSITQQQELDINNIAIDDLLVDSQGKIHPTLKRLGDLPQGFTAKDCESLLDSLDHTSTMME